MSKTSTQLINIGRNNTTVDYISSLKLEGIGIFNKPESFKFQKNFSNLKLPPGKGKSTVIKSILYVLFNKKFPHFESYLPHNDFYAEINFKYSKTNLNFINKKGNSNLEQEINLKFKDEIEKEAAFIYFEFLNNVKDIMIINEEKLNSSFNLKLKKEELEQFKDKNLNLKIKKLYKNFEIESGYNLDEDLNMLVEELKERYNKILNELNEDLNEIKEKLKEEKELEEEKQLLEEKIANLKEKINKENISEIYKEITKLLNIFNNIKNEGKKYTNIIVNEEKIKHTLNNNFTKKLETLKNKIEELNTFYENVLVLIGNLINERKFPFEKEEYNKFSSLLEEIYKLILKLEDYEDSETIKQDIILLFKLKENEPEKFAYIKNNFEKLEKIFELDDYENELDEFLNDVIENKNELFMNLIKRYASNIIFFIPLVEELFKVETIKNIKENKIFNFFINLFSLNNIEDIYELVLEIALINNSIEYETFSELFNQLLTILEEEASSKIKENNINYQNIIKEIKKLIDKYKEETQKEINEILSTNIIKEKTLDEEFLNDGINELKEKLKKEIGYKYEDKSFLDKNPLNIEIQKYDEIELNYYVYISELVRKKEAIENDIKELIMLEEKKEKIINRLEIVKNIIEKLYEKYANKKTKYDNFNYVKMNIPLRIENNIKENNENYEKEIEELYSIINLQQKYKEALKTLKEYYTSDNYNIIDNNNDAIEYINNLANKYLGNIQFNLKNGSIWIRYNEEDNEIEIPLDVANIYYKTVFLVLNTVMINNTVRNENKNLMLFIDEVDKNLTEIENKELIKFLKIITAENCIQIIYTSR